MTRKLIFMSRGVTNQVLPMEEQVSQGDFTDMSWQAVLGALDVAKNSKQQVVETEHLMKALLEQKNGLARRIFSKAGLDNTALLQTTEHFIERQPKVVLLFEGCFSTNYEPYFLSLSLSI
ncbi:hypothetical protein O6H91_Y161300 [Diphasiastrum complanatum]|nr:hypothetical protein O6H91_Y161300 [Diphasiastrum complanatum]